jgi:transposase InsO family protein
MRLKAKEPQEDEVDRQKKNRFYRLDEDEVLYVYRPSQNDINDNTEPWKVYIPRTLVPDILKLYHDSLEGGHRSDAIMYETIRHRVFWPRMAADVTEYCRGCDVCQRNKVPPNMKKGHLQPVHIPFVMTELSIDLMGPLPETEEGYTYILVVTDIGSRWCEAYPLKRANAVEVATTLHREWFCRFGAPLTIVTDNASIFTGHVWNELASVNGIKVVHTAVYHPQSNLTERMNKEIGIIIRCFVTHQHNAWAEVLPRVMLAIRTARHSRMKTSSAHLILGYEPRLPWDFLWSPGTPTAPKQQAIDWRINMEKHRIQRDRIWEVIREELIKSHEKNESQYNIGRRHLELRIGDWVRVKSHKQPSAEKGTTKKFLERFEGPYKIVEASTSNSYMLEDTLPPFGRRGPYHISQIHPWNAPWSLTKDKLSVNVKEVAPPGAIQQDIEKRMQTKFNVKVPPLAKHAPIIYEDEQFDDEYTMEAELDLTTDTTQSGEQREGGRKETTDLDSQVEPVTNTMSESVRERPSNLRQTPKPKVNKDFVSVVCPYRLPTPVYGSSRPKGMEVPPPAPDSPTCSGSVPEAAKADETDIVPEEKAPEGASLETGASPVLAIHPDSDLLELTQEQSNLIPGLETPKDDLLSSSTETSPTKTGTPKTKHALEGAELTEAVKKWVTEVKQKSKNFLKGREST